MIKRKRMIGLTDFKSSSGIAKTILSRKGWIRCAALRISKLGVELPSL